jgi:putative phage-type endonuclease
MPITSEQQKLRKQSLGSSDMAAILGRDPFKTAYDVWLDKTNRVPDMEENEAMEAGTLFENGVLDWAEKHLGLLERNVHIKIAGLPIASNLDARVKSTSNPVEAKTSGLMSGMTLEQWGEPYTDDVPERVLIQSHVHMMAANAYTCHIPVFICGRGFVMFEVHRFKGLCEIIANRATQFWEENVLANVEPENSMPSPELAKKMKRQPSSVAYLKDDIISKWIDAKVAVDMAEEELEKAQVELLVALNSCEEGRSGLGTITYYEQGSKRLDSARLKEEAPDIFKAFTKESRHRVLRFKPAKN